MRVAFVFAPYSHKKFEENIYVVDEDFGIFPPLNLAYAAAIAERAGHEARLFDANALVRLGKATPAEVVEDVAAFRADAGEVNENHWTVLADVHGRRIGIRQIASVGGRRLRTARARPAIVAAGALVLLAPALFYFSHGGLRRDPLAPTPRGARPRRRP